VTRASIAQGAVDFSELAAEIARADPDVVIFAGFNPEAGLLLRQLRDAGWGGSYATGDGVCGGPGCDFLVNLGALAEGVAFSGCTPPLPTTFVEDFEAVHDASDPDDEHGRPTASFVAHYADAVTILLDAVAAVAVRTEDGSLRVNPTLLRGVVAAARVGGGLSGDVAFDSSGDRRLMGEVSGLEHVARELGLVPCFVENGMIAYFN
jgi:ABC-type branched-subunit amino acid transport system substrate-binding protein